MSSTRAAVIGAGIGGLVSALELRLQGFDVTIFERSQRPGGKIRQLAAGDRFVDAGPTVFTMRWVFDRIFADAGERLEDHLRLTPLSCLARHAWNADERLDLFSDIDRTAEAIRAFSGPADASAYRGFCARAREIYETLEAPYIASSQPTPVSLVMGAGLSGLGGILRISPFATLWSELAGRFNDPRLQQLFGRYATYVGSSPFSSPATLMLIAHVEQAGVWVLDGGMYRLIEVLSRIVTDRGADLRCGSEVVRIETDSRGCVAAVHLSTGERFACDAVICNADANALPSGTLGQDVVKAAPPISRQSRSLSALTWTMLANTRGFDLAHHNVFFSENYKREFDDMLVHGRLPFAPTVYVCAEDRRDGDGRDRADGPERLLILVNAPANGDGDGFTQAEIDQCKERTFARLTACGLHVEPIPETVVQTSPTGFARLFPATGGALYGQATHGWTASFSRATARTAVPGLYLAGGSVHPGAGVPMAAISGWLAAASLTADRSSRGRSARVAMPGGMSTR